MYNRKSVLIDVAIGPNAYNAHKSPPLIHSFILFLSLSYCAILTQHYVQKNILLTDYNSDLP